MAFDDELLLSTSGTSIGFFDKIEASNIRGACEAIHSTAEEVNLIPLFFIVYIYTAILRVSGGYVYSFCCPACMYPEQISDFIRSPHLQKMN